jgi:hypothetical protein
MISQAKVLSYDNRVRLFWTLVIIFVISLVLYVYGVNATVRNTVLRQELETQVSNLTLKISEMEFSYISLKNNVNIDIAYARGYQDVAKPTYITRGSSRSLSYNALTR